MVDCQKCKHCEWDADYAFGSKGGLAFPCDCRRDRQEFFDLNAEECEEYEEFVPWDEVEEWDADIDFRESGLTEDD